MTYVIMSMPTTIIVHTHQTNDTNHLNGASHLNHPLFKVKVLLNQIIMQKIPPMNTPK